MVDFALHPMNAHRFDLAGLACCGSDVRVRSLGNIMLGDAATEAKIGQIATGAVSTVGGAFTPVIAHSLFASAATGVMPLWAVPVVGAAVAGVVLALAAIFGRKGPKQKEAATQIVNQVADLMRDNLNAYMAGPRTRASQLMALEAFDQAWAWMESADGCGNPALGDAGRRCIEERRRGGSAPWCPTGTGCDFFHDLRDPIANDPRPGELEAAEASSTLLPSVSAASVSLPGVGSVPVLLLVGVALIAWGVSQ